jgi:hypothetical protein
MKAISLALSVCMVSLGARAADPVYDAQDKPPDVYGPLLWRGGGVDAHGYFFRDEQVNKLNLRLQYLEDKATKDCITTTNAANKSFLASHSSLWIIGGTALVVGILGGFYLGRR